MGVRKWRRMGLVRRQAAIEGFMGCHGGRISLAFFDRGCWMRRRNFWCNWVMFWVLVVVMWVMGVIEGCRCNR